MENSMFFCRHFLKASQNDYTFFMEFFPRKCTSCWLRTDLGLANTLQNSTWTYSNSSIYTKIKHWIIKSCKGKINSFWLTSLNCIWWSYYYPLTQWWWVREMLPYVIFQSSPVEANYSDTTMQQWLTCMPALPPAHCRSDAIYSTSGYKRLVTI